VEVWKIQAFAMGRRVMRVAIAVPGTFILTILRSLEEGRRWFWMKVVRIIRID
jgi:hypothetical protein